MMFECPNMFYSSRIKTKSDVKGRIYHIVRTLELRPH